MDNATLLCKSFYGIDSLLMSERIDIAGWWWFLLVCRERWSSPKTNGIQADYTEQRKKIACQTNSKLSFLAYNLTVCKCILSYFIFCIDFLLRVISTAKFFVCPTQLLFKHYNTFVLLSSLYINADWIQNLFSVEISHCKPELFKFLKVADGLTQLTLWTFLCRCWEVGVHWVELQYTLYIFQGMSRRHN